jgi:hypothetical protein
MQFLNIYVAGSPEGQRNLGIGIARGMWGIKAASAAKKIHIPGDDRTGLAILEAIEPGDIVLFATGGPSSRVSAGGWAEASLRRGVMGRVTTAHHVDSMPVWPDDVYEHRFGFEVAQELDGVTSALIGPASMEALRVSANSYGLPIPPGVRIPPPADLESTMLDEELLWAGPTDGQALAAFRREQATLRAALIRGGTLAECALCGVEMDASALRVAHIKRRSECSDAERLDLSNVMLACLFGCDYVFEQRFVVVAESGTVSPGAEPLAPAVRAYVARIAGRPCKALTQQSARFFESHRVALAA